MQKNNDAKQAESGLAPSRAAMNVGDGLSSGGR